MVYGGADVDLVTGAENISHPTQSETYTLANPDNPNQIVVTYNDSRTASANYSGASYSSDGGTTFTRLNPSPFAADTGRTLATRLLSTTNLPARSLRFFWLQAAADRASAPGSPLTVESPGLLALAFTTAALTIASLAGPTTTLHLPSLDGCTFPGTTSLLAAAPSKSPSPLITVTLGPCEQ